MPPCCCSSTGNKAPELLDKGKLNPGCSQCDDIHTTNYFTNQATQTPMPMNSRGRLSSSTPMISKPSPCGHGQVPTGSIKNTHTHTHTTHTPTHAHARPSSRESKTANPTSAAEFSTSCQTSAKTGQALPFWLRAVWQMCCRGLVTRAIHSD